VKACSMISTASRASKHSSETKQSAQNMGTHDRILPDPAIYRHESSSRVCRRSLSKHDTLARSMGADNRQIIFTGSWSIISRE
jgi:hypothetical protein